MLQDPLELSIAEMCSSITNNDSRSTKAYKQPLKKFDHNSSNISGQCLSFYPRGHAIPGDSNVFFTIGARERPDKINPLYIKHFTKLNHILRHLVKASEIPGLLAFVTRQHMFLSILKYSRLIKS